MEQILESDDYLECFEMSISNQVKPYICRYDNLVFGSHSDDLFIDLNFYLVFVLPLVRVLFDQSSVILSLELDSLKT